MDQLLVAWARSVQARRPGGQRGMPVLWLFSDAARLPDLAASIAALPRGLCGVVVRHATDVAEVARACRRRRIALVITDAALAGQHGSGLHMRGGRKPLHAPKGFRTASAHNVAELRRAGRNGAQLVFLSPVFPTASHPGRPGLGALRWAMLSRCARVPVYALGGVTGRTVRRLPRWCAGAGAIGALAVP